MFSLEWMIVASAVTVGLLIYAIRARSKPILYLSLSLVVVCALMMVSLFRAYSMALPL